jgi:hypothetical protein
MSTFPVSSFQLLQVIAAFVIFVVGYIALFVSLMIFLFTAKGLYASAKAVRAYARRGSTNGRSTSLDGDISAHQEKSLVFLTTKPRLVGT